MIMKQFKAALVKQLSEAFTGATPTPKTTGAFGTLRLRHGDLYRGKFPHLSRWPVAGARARVDVGAHREGFSTTRIFVTITLATGEVLTETAKARRKREAAAHKFAAAINTAAAITTPPPTPPA